MNKDHFREPTKNKENQQILEISSTGYGLESVTTDNSENRQSGQESSEKPSCGGL